jgi:hypothetical protein
MSLTAFAQIQTRRQPGREQPPANPTKQRSLQRLYERRAAVDQLIGALERYQREHRQMPETLRVEGLSVIGR